MFPPPPGMGEARIENREPLKKKARSRLLLPALAALLGACVLRAEDPELRPPPVVATNLAEAHRHVEALLSLLAEDLRKADRTAYDPEALAAGLGEGLYPAFSFVRDQVGFEAYPGLLRGPEGTLRARAGNSLDKALLLCRLLEKKGIACRLARGRLSREKVDAWLVDERQRAGSNGADGSPPTEEEKAPAFALVTPSRRSEETGRAFEELDHRAGRALARFDRLFKAGQLEWDLGSPMARDGARASLETHYWVLARQEKEWLHLDPSFRPALGPGRHATEIDVELAPPSVAELAQRVTLRVHLEQFTSAGLTDRVILDADWSAPELDGRRLLLSLVPETMADERLALGEASLAESRTLLGAGRVFVPLLVAGDRRVAGDAFDVRGNAVSPAQVGRPPGSPADVPAPSAARGEGARPSTKGDKGAEPEAGGPEGAQEGAAAAAPATAAPAGGAAPGATDSPAPETPPGTGTPSGAPADAPVAPAGPPAPAEPVAPAGGPPASDRPAAGAPFLTCLWFELVFSAPGAPPETAVRVLVDHAGDRFRLEGKGPPPTPQPDRETALELLCSYDFLVLTGAVNLGWATERIGRDLLAHGPLIDHFLESRYQGVTAIGLREALGRSSTPPPELVLFALGSDLLAEEARRQQPWARIYHGRPAVVATVDRAHRLRDGTLSQQSGIDLLAPAWDVLRLGYREIGQPPPQHLAFRVGVFQTFLEALLRPGPWSAGSILNQAEWEGVPFGFVTFEGQMADLPVTPFEADAARRAVRGKRLLFLPARTVSADGPERYAWWQLDRATGETLGITDGDKGGAPEEWLGNRAADFIFERGTAEQVGGFGEAALSNSPEPGRGFPSKQRLLDYWAAREVDALVRAADREVLGHLDRRIRRLDPRARGRFADLRRGGVPFGYWTHLGALCEALLRR
ncbi:MAG: hypothetical protein HYZ53_23605 [Planctomycetes bacterium]|nr:hypothetical protein [Planctomycetota bacterium]